MLPCEPGDETRSLLYCSVDAPCGRIPVFVTHLSWKLHQSDIRQQQVAFIAARIKELAPVDRGFPPVLMGDFNAEPESDEIRYLRGYNTRLGRSVYFADCFAVAGDGSPGYTYARDNPYALRAHEPNRRLDYIFVARPRSRTAWGATHRPALLHRAPRAASFPRIIMGFSPRSRPLRASSSRSREPGSVESPLLRLMHSSRREIARWVRSDPSTTDLNGRWRGVYCPQAVNLRRMVAADNRSQSFAFRNS